MPAMSNSSQRPPTLAECHRALVRSANLSAREWVGRCHEVCTRLLELNDVRRSLIQGRLDGARLIRGRWAGGRTLGAAYPVKAENGHSWLVLADGRIFDPTCWAFTSTEPRVVIADPNDGRWAADSSEATA